jgi:tetratricopeptide (TPR) repeat protein
VAKKHRLVFIFIGVALVVVTSLPFLMNASCLTRPQTAGEQQALDNLRRMTRNDVLPAETVVADIENKHPRTKAAALARMLRARIKFNAGDFAGAASLLDTKLIAEQTALADYALSMRAANLALAQRFPEARAVFQQLMQDHPTSLLARQAALEVAGLMMKSGDDAAVPLLLKDLIQADDSAALFAAAKAYEQTSDQNRALASYRRIYFFAPQSDESAEAATAITRLGSTVSPATVEEAMTRADRLYSAKKFNDALTAYTDAFARFPATRLPHDAKRLSR